MESFLIDVPMPSMGATVNELTVIDLFIEPGARITKGQRLAELESDKSAFDFEAPCDGSVKAILVRAGDIVPSGSPFLRIETSDVSLRHLETRSTSPAAAPVEAAVRGHDARSLAEVRAVTLEEAQPGNGHLPPAKRAARPTETAGRPLAGARPSVAGGSSLVWTPRAHKLAVEAGLDPAAVSDLTPTGPGGRVSGDDVVRYLELHARPTARAAAAAPGNGDFLPFAEETVSVAGIGYALPKKVQTNQEILKSFPHMTEEEILKLMGIQERRYASEGESATSLAVTAVQHALAMANLKPSDIDGIIMATLIPDQPVPSAASALAKQLGIKTALAFDLNAACAGWLYALEVGRSFIRSGTAKRLIVVTAELLSRITNPKDHSTAFLFGDGAGAAILTDAADGHRLNLMHLSGDATHYEAIQRTGGGALHPVPQPGDPLDKFYLQMDGAVVFKNAVLAFSEMIEWTLRRHRLKCEEIAWIVPHQANARILRAVSKRVGIPYEKFVVTIGKYGNTSAASVSMALGWAAEEEIFNPGDKIIFCAVGAGFTYAGGLLTW